MSTPRPRPHRSRLSWSIPFLGYFVLAALVTFPFILSPTRTLTAPIGGDISTSVARWEVFSREEVNPYMAHHLKTVGFPEGTSTSPGVDRVSFLSTLVLWVGASTVGSVATHGIISLLGYFLTASLTFLLVRRITGSTGGAFIAGIAVGFSQHMYVITWAANLYSHMWLLILPIWAFVLLAESQSRRRVLVASCSIIPAFFWTPYYALHVLVVAAACLAVLAMSWVKRSELQKLKSLVPILAVFCLVMLAFWLIGLTTSFQDVPRRSQAEAYEQSAHPLMFVVPTSKIWGSAPGELLARLVPRAGGGLYVGLSVLSLAVLGLIATARALRGGGPNDSVSVGIAGAMAAAVAFLTFLFSLPPTFAMGSLDVPTPNFVVTSLVPAFRAGQRFVMPLIGALGVLAGVGASYLLGRVRGLRLVMLVAFVSSIVWVDLWTRPEPASTTIPEHSALRRLAAMPREGTLHYPIELFRGEFFAIQVPCLLQPQHQMPLINSCEVAPQTSLVTELRETPPCEALIKARKAGAKYVILERSSAEGQACLERPELLDHREVASDATFRVIEFTGGGEDRSGI